MSLKLGQKERADEKIGEKKDNSLLNGMVRCILHTLAGTQKTPTAAHERGKTSVAAANQQTS